MRRPCNVDTSIIRAVANSFNSFNYTHKQIPGVRALRCIYGILCDVHITNDKNNNNNNNNNTLWISVIAVLR